MAPGYIPEDMGHPSKFETVFRKPRAFLPVIHAHHHRLELDTVQVALDNGADGIFVINQGIGIDKLFWGMTQLWDRFPELWVGMNLLGVHGRMALNLAKGADFPLGGLWSDDIADLIGVSWGGLNFGGVAFKYKTPVPQEQLPEVARRAAGVVDVCTSSGPATGKPADLAKVVALKYGLQEAPLALASGLTVDNIDPVLPYVDAYLVATGIEVPGEVGILDPGKVRAMADKIHASTPKIIPESAS